MNKLKMLMFTALAAVVLGVCATLPTFNPDDVTEVQLVSLSLRSTAAGDIDSSFAIAAINGVPVEQEVGAELIESNGRVRVTAVQLPAGTHVFTVRLANGRLGNRSLYHNQELDIEFTLDGASNRYELTRENSILTWGTLQSYCVRRDPGFRCSLLSSRKRSTRL